MTPTEFTEIRYEVTDGVALVTLNRPDRRNAWSGPMAVEYRWALHHADTDPEVRVVIVTGAGGDFCAGADTRQLTEISDAAGSYARTRADLPPYPDGTPSELRHNHCYPLTIGVPVIAVITGACAGAGFVLATYADLRWAAEDAKITTSFSRLGLPAEYGTAWLLARQVGVPNALQLLWDNRVRSGLEAKECGWVQHTAPSADVLAAATNEAHRLADTTSALSLKTMKRAVLIDATLDMGTAYTRSVDDMNYALTQPDFSHGLHAARHRDGAVAADPGPGSAVPAREPARETGAVAGRPE